MNGDGAVNISDVTALIDYLLSGTWNLIFNNNYVISLMPHTGVRDFYQHRALAGFIFNDEPLEMQLLLLSFVSGESPARGV